MHLGELLNDNSPATAPWRDVEITGLAADSRKVAPGYLFFALSGSHADGARFISDACQRGAAAVLAGAAAQQAREAQAIPVITSGNPRRALALAAARFYGRQPECAVAVTGTNGKTSVASFLRQIWLQAGLGAASIGTVGLVTAKGERALSHTTPDPIALHEMLRELSDEGISHVALEASSHGLAQYRVDGVKFKAAGFTNISRDHLDYHQGFEDYFGSKLRLFGEVMAPGSAAVINADSDHAGAVADVAARRGLEVLTVGEAGSALRLVSHSRAAQGQDLVVEAAGRRHELTLPLVGDFQASNALVAAGLAIAAGLDAAVALAALERLRGATGRLEMVGQTSRGALIFVDYAHTPDALKTVLETLRPYTSRRLITVFGAGGDRDRGKRAMMGKVVSELADIAIVTDDNPRSEDPAAIRSEIMAAVPQALEIGDRGTAIAAGIKMAGAGDVLLIAGKGHESGQTVGDVVIPFSDHEAVASALRRGGRSG
ncbi:MAG: UDP-N-acetylmuramoyl-L-alanyl-D-glutamate--2,6-diaminopimelate ligase [Rhodobiaceae bacterium]|nr:UDP-N-acetylmuramoyl-L-alanyl-D-glutamate--2,6-diaminopimelate ligase [Rhodobiaceae bacterium]